MCAVIYSKSKLASASQICWFNRAKISGVRLTSGKGLQTQKPNDDLKVGYGPFLIGREWFADKMRRLFRCQE